MSDEPPMSNERPKREYEVGYGKPPRHTQFQKGQSGNPKGRKAAEKNLRTLVEAELDAIVTVTENGRPVRKTKRELLAIQLVHRALKGDHRAWEALQKLLQQKTPNDDEQDSGPADTMSDIDTDDEQAVLDDILSRLPGAKS